MRKNSTVTIIIILVALLLIAVVIWVFDKRIQHIVNTGQKATSYIQSIRNPVFTVPFIHFKKYSL